MRQVDFHRASGTSAGAARDLDLTHALDQRALAGTLVSNNTDLRKRNFVVLDPQVAQILYLSNQSPHILGYEVDRILSGGQTWGAGELHRVYSV